MQSTPRVQTFTVLRVLVCENRIVYCAGRIRCFPGKRRSQEVQHFIGKHKADSVQTLVTLTARMQEVKTFGLIRYLVQSIKQGMPSHTAQPQVGILNSKKNQLSGGKTPLVNNVPVCCKVFLQMITECRDRRQHTLMIIEPMRGDYHSFHNLSIFSQIEFTRQITRPD